MSDETTPDPLPNYYDPAPGLVARGVMSDDHDPEACESTCCEPLIEEDLTEALDWLFRVHDADSSARRLGIVRQYLGEASSREAASATRARAEGRREAMRDVGLWATRRKAFMEASRERDLAVDRNRVPTFGSEFWRGNEAALDDLIRTVTAEEPTDPAFRADSLTPDTTARTIPTTASVRAGLAADTAADNKVRWNRALKGGA